MGWEYTRSRRIESRVVREYLGAGLVGRLSAEADRIKRERVEAEKVRHKRELERLEALVSPAAELWEAAEVARPYRRLIARTAAAGDPLIEDAVMTRAEMMRLEIARENASALELLLTDKIVTLYLLSELHESLTTVQLSRDNTDHRVPVSYTLQMVKWQESVNRRYLAAIRELARVRKLQAGAAAAALCVDPRDSTLAGASAGLDAN